MFRYFLPIILSGGRSLRFGLNKTFFIKNKFSFMDFRLNFFFELGFINVSISGFHRDYSFLLDYFFIKSPFNGIFSSIFYNKKYYFTHFLFIPIDMTMFCYFLFFNLFFNSTKFFSYFNQFFFPFLLSVSFNLFIFISLNNFLISYSLILVTKFLLSYYVSLYKFNNLYFFNLNIYYNLFLYLR